MAGRIILFGATGYTGRLTAEALANRSAERVVLAGRNQPALAALAGELEEAHDWSCDLAVADATDTTAVMDLIGSPDDVMISTVGPYTRYGRPALEAATAAGAIYLDCSGEPPFIRRVFDYYGPRALRTGASLLTGFGYDYVPGNLAGLIALRRAEQAGFVPDRIDIGYFLRLRGQTPTFSSGTLASSLAVLAEPSFAFRDGAVSAERPGREVRSFSVENRRRDGLSMGGTEHYTLPRIDPRLTQVRVFLGWAGSRTRLFARAGRVIDPVTRIPMVRPAVRRLAATLAPGSHGGPSAVDRSRALTAVVAEAFRGDAKVASITVLGPNPYELTADLLAWGADEALHAGLGNGSSRRTGALGPADAFGELGFIEGARTLGLAATD